MWTVKDLQNKRFFNKELKVTYIDRSISPKTGKERRHSVMIGFDKMVKIATQEEGKKALLSMLQRIVDYDKDFPLEHKFRRGCSLKFYQRNT